MGLIELLDRLHRSKRNVLAEMVLPASFNSSNNGLRVVLGVYLGAVEAVGQEGAPELLFVGGKPLIESARKALDNGNFIPALELLMGLESGQGMPVVEYNGLLWQPEKIDQLVTFDIGLAQIRAHGYQRFPRPAQSFGLLIDFLEGRLQEGSPQHTIAQNMAPDGSEWLSAAHERKGDLLHVYIDPENLIWQNQYVFDGEPVYNKEESPEPFDITGFPSLQGVPIQKMPEDYIQFMYGRKAEDLPEQMHPGYTLLPRDVVLPVGRGCDLDNFIRFRTLYGASRGVRDFSSENEGEK